MEVRLLCVLSTRCDASSAPQRAMEESRREATREERRQRRQKREEEAERVGQQIETSSSEAIAVVTAAQTLTEVCMTTPCFVGVSYTIKIKQLQSG